MVCGVIQGMQYGTDRYALVRTFPQVFLHQRALERPCATLRARAASVYVATN